MRIEYDIKLGFKDVMFRPKRSTLKSRSQVSLDRTFLFRNSQKEWTGVPIMAANMDTVGTFEMVIKLAANNIFTAIHKHYTFEEWDQFLKTAPKDIEKYIAISTGTAQSDLEKISKVIEAHPQLQFICIDVANGYSEHFVEFVKQARAQFPTMTIWQAMWLPEKWWKN